MAKITVYLGLYEETAYTVDLNRQFEGYEEGDIICHCCPFSIPLKLEIAIRRNGLLVFRAWEWTDTTNHYLHTVEETAEMAKKKGTYNPMFESGYIVPTPEQRDTIAGLFSGRIKFDGLRLAVGRTLLEIAPIDIKAEEEKCGEKIFLA